MELLLNSVWALVALGSVCIWRTLGPRTPQHRRLSLIGLVMLVVILFPVISVSDDLWSIQNPAETDTCLRRDHRDAGAQIHLPGTAALPEPAFAFTLEYQQLDSPRPAAPAVIGNPALNPIENRPPPAA